MRGEKNEVEIMTKRWSCLIVLLILMTLSGGCISKDESKVLSEKVISEENIGGKYNAKLVTLEIPIQNESYRDEYKKESGKDIVEEKEIQYSIGDKHYRGSYWPDFWPPFTDSLDWIKSNSSESSIFMNWWDYGHMLKGATGRDVIIANPSKESALKTISMIGTVMDEKTYEERYGYETPEKLKDVAIAFTTDDITLTNQIMDKYHAKYIYTTNRDLDLIGVMGDAIPDGGYYTEINTDSGKQTVPSQKFYNSTLARLLLFKGNGLENYRLVYESQPKSDGSEEKRYKDVYNAVYGGNLQVEDSGYIKIFEYVKGAK
ncbi:MAG: hypothetical protein O8C64_04695 [Candidatus Methanoperedens sp.]|nr:hypothetical protein [Candidatus Methanoperedens sp.]MCZ7404319.1 hypothetical protein [Candidatus Methanoperedens sp.]